MGEIESTKLEVLSRIQKVATHQDNILQLLYSSQAVDSDVSHLVFELSPQTELRLLDQCNFRIVSQWAFERLLEVYQAQRADAVSAFYYYILRSSDAAALRGNAFERHVLNYLDDINVERNFPIRRLSSSERTTWTYRGSIPRFDFPQDSDFIGQITNAVNKGTPLHLVPLIQNFRAVDSILYYPNDVLTCIQTTICRTSHPIIVSGLQLIQSWLRPGTPLADLRPSKERPWRFIFIVPSDEASFKLQPLQGNTAQDEWSGKVHQYVLGLDVVGKKTKQCLDSDLGDSSRFDHMDLS